MFYGVDRTPTADMNQLLAKLRDHDDYPVLDAAEKLMFANRRAYAARRSETFD